MSLETFERIVRDAHNYDDRPDPNASNLHPFDINNIHDKVKLVVRSLFDDGHYAQATFEACKYLEEVVRQNSKLTSSSGQALMFAALKSDGSCLKINSLSSQAERDEQDGYAKLLAGAMAAIRNPRGHTVGLQDDPDRCLEYLCFISLLLRILEESGHHLV